MVLWTFDKKWLVVSLRPHVHRGLSIMFIVKRWWLSPLHSILSLGLLVIIVNLGCRTELTVWLQKVRRTIDVTRIKKYHRFL